MHAGAKPWAQPKQYICHHLKAFAQMKSSVKTEDKAFILLEMKKKNAVLLTILVYLFVCCYMCSDFKVH